MLVSCMEHCNWTLGDSLQRSHICVFKRQNQNQLQTYWDIRNSRKLLQGAWTLPVCSEIHIRQMTRLFTLPDLPVPLIAQLCCSRASTGHSVWVLLLLTSLSPSCRVGTSATDRLALLKDQN